MLVMKVSKRSRDLAQPSSRARSRLSPRNRRAIGKVQSTDVHLHRDLYSSHRTMINSHQSVSVKRPAITSPIELSMFAERRRWKRPRHDCGYWRRLPTWSSSAVRVFPGIIDASDPSGVARLLSPPPPLCRVVHGLPRPDADNALPPL